jgi:Tol biopolymer transport system component
LSFSPEQNTLAFSGSIRTSIGNTEFNIYAYDITTKELSQLTEGQGENFWPSWLPNVNYMLFESIRFGDYEIYLMKRGESAVTNLTQNPSGDSFPLWRDLRDQ